MEQKTIAIENALNLIRDDLEKVDLEVPEELKIGCSYHFCHRRVSPLQRRVSDFAPFFFSSLQSCAGTRRTAISPWPALSSLFIRPRCFTTMWWTRRKSAEGMSPPIPNGEMKPVSWSGISSSPRAFHFSLKRELGNLSGPLPGHNPHGRGGVGGIDPNQ